jgi:hypothetical protein
MSRVFALVSALVLSSCASSQCSRSSGTLAGPVDGGAPAVTPVATGSAVASDSPADASASAVNAPAPAKEPSPREAFAAWLKAHLPTGGEVVDEGDAPIRVVHTAQAGDDAQSIAKAYLDLSDVYFTDDFAAEITRAARKVPVAIRAGSKIPIPHLLAEPYKTGDDARIGWPADKTLRGLYIRGATATKPMFLFILDQMAKRDINAIVLDAKDYDGPVTYASKIPLVLETHAARGAPIRDLARVIRFVHQRGIRVIMRVSCFNDELMAKAKPNLSVQSKWGKPYPLGWLDPTNVEAQNYVLDLVKETMDAGADEIQLDYVRFPVLGIKGADFHLEERNLVKINVIRDFVRRAHELTRPRGVPLSLDVFGVIAQGRRIDIDALGQDMVLLAPECEVLSPMVYPSHYSKGFYGWEIPGDHPEIIGIGVKGSLEQIAGAPKDVPLAVVRPWLQAMSYKAPTYSPHYLSEEIRTGNQAGATGWLMWNPSQEYGYAWAAVPPRAVPKTEVAASGTSGARAR